MVNIYKELADKR